MGLYGEPNVFPCHILSLVGHHCDAKRSDVCTSHEASCFDGSATRYDLKFSYRVLCLKSSARKLHRIRPLLLRRFPFGKPRLCLSGVIQTNGNGVP